MFDALANGVFLVNCVTKHARHTDRQIVFGEISVDDGVFVCLFLPWLSATLESIVTIVNPSWLQLPSVTKEQATNCWDEPHLKPRRWWEIFNRFCLEYFFRNNHNVFFSCIPNQCRQRQLLKGGLTSYCLLIFRQNRQSGRTMNGLQMCQSVTCHLKP